MTMLSLLQPPAKRTTALPAWVGLIVGLLLSFIHTTSGYESHDKASWYTRYKAYPPYCSTPSEMETRSVPPLNGNDARIGDSRLVHVTSIIRHGARTPYAAADNYQCWEGYWADPETGVWDCDLTTFLAPPTPRDVQREEGGKHNNNNKDALVDDKDSAMFFFEKKYDALQQDAEGPNLKNLLNGTCQLGQLLLRGYEQELANGKHLRNAYLYDGTTMNHDPRLRLIDLSVDSTSGTPPFAEPNLKYRSDDDQRTLMSGQVLLRGLFGQEFVKHVEQHGAQPIIPLHTADRTNDVLDSNARVCPRLYDLWYKAEQTNEYQAFNNSKESKMLRNFMVQELGQNFEFNALDCMMTTMCTDRALPKELADYDGVEPSNNDDNNGNRRYARALHHGEDDSDSDSDNESSDDSSDSDDWNTGGSLFQRLMDWNVAQFVFPFLYNNAAYSKLAMQPLWREIYTNMLPFLPHSNQHLDDRPAPPTKLALFSGHDTTIVPLLATLGNKLWNVTDWPPYASMVIIEIHEFVDFKTDRSIYKSDFAFRLLYNGKVMTPLLDGCPSGADLCDMAILERIIHPYATEPWRCDSDGTYYNSMMNQQQQTTSFGGVFLVLGFCLFSAAMGGLATFFYLTGKMPCSAAMSLPSRYHFDKESELALTGEVPPSFRDHPEGVDSELEPTPIT